MSAGRVSDEVLGALASTEFLDPLVMGRITGLKASPLILSLARELRTLRERDKRYHEAQTCGLLQRAHRSIVATHDEGCRYCEIVGDDPDADTCATVELIDDLAEAASGADHQPREAQTCGTCRFWRPMRMWGGGVSTVMNECSLGHSSQGRHWHCADHQPREEAG